MAVAERLEEFKDKLPFYACSFIIYHAEGSWNKLGNKLKNKIVARLC